MFGKIGEMKQMYDKYKKLQDVLKNLIIRSSAGSYSYTSPTGDTKVWSIVVDINGEMKVQNIDIKDIDLLQASKKSEIEWLLKEAFDKAQTKAQQVAMEKTKEVLWFDPNELLGGMAWWGMPKIPGLM